LPRGRPIDQSRWPDDGDLRRWLEYLEKLRCDNGVPSQRTIAKSMHLAAPTPIGQLLSGLRLPVDEAQARLLLAAVGGVGPEIERGLRLYSKVRARGSAAEPARPSPAGQGRHPTPTVWRVPTRNVAFTGRHDVVDSLHKRLRSAGRAAPQALHGMGGVGKSQIAIEFAHRFADEYGIVWWIESEHPELITKQLAALAAALGLTAPSADTDSTLDVLRDHLRRRRGWLLIFDNADEPRTLHRWLPDGPGHVLITSRHHSWTELADPVPIDVFARAESIALLRRHRSAMGGAECEAMAEALGDLPLAIAQASGLLASTGMPTATYLTELGRHAGRMTSHPAPLHYPVSLAAAVQLSAAQVTSADEAAGYLLRVCAFLAPEPIPHDLFLGDAVGTLLPAAPAATVGNPIALGQAFAKIASYGLMRINDGDPVLHRLTQAIIRDDLPPEDQRHFRHVVDSLLVAARPDDGRMPELWPRWALLLPHILAADPARSSDHELRHLACSAVWQLHAQGDARAALPLARSLYESWLQAYGPDDRYTMFAASNLGSTYRVLGEYEMARHFDDDTLRRRGRVLGAEHPHTLGSAHKLATDLRHLGDFAGALEVDEVNHELCRKVLGPDHHYAFTSACNLATDLRLLGRTEEARALHEKTLGRQREHIGDDDQETLATANELAEDLRELGEWDRSRELREDVLVGRRKVLGDGHPHTLATAHALAEDLLRGGDPDGSHLIASDVFARRLRLWGDDHWATRESAQLLHSIREAGRQPERSIPG
jgi:hypothetical protein